jgi:hypothetical protein
MSAFSWFDAAIGTEFRKELVKSAGRLTFETAKAVGREIVRIWWSGKRNEVRVVPPRKLPQGAPVWFDEMEELYRCGANAPLAELIARHESEIWAHEVPATRARMKNIVGDVKMHYNEDAAASRYLRSAFADAQRAEDPETITHICNNASVFKMHQRGRLNQAKCWLKRAPNQSQEWTLYNLLAIASIEKDVRACMLAGFDLLSNFPENGLKDSLLRKDTDMDFFVNGVLSRVMPLVAKAQKIKAKKQIGRTSSTRRAAICAVALGAALFTGRASFGGMKVGGAPDAMFSPTSAIHRAGPGERSERTIQLPDEY